MKFEIVCDSAADLSSSDAEKAQITIVPYYVSMDGVTYLREGKDISVSDFYQEMINNEDCFPKTSMPSIQDYMDAFEPLVQQGKNILCICLTQKFSGSYQCAVNAKMMLEDDYPDAHIYVMDSQLVTALEGLFVLEAVRLRNLDLTLEEAAPLLEEIRSSGQIFFTTKDLKYLQHGGRLGKAACVAGSMLNLKPVLRFCDGELGNTEVCPGRKRSIAKIIDKFFNYLKENDVDMSQYYFGTGVGAEVPEYAEFCETLKQRLEEEGIHPSYWAKIQIGATIGVHTGPYPMGLGILKKCDVK